VSGANWEGNWLRDLDSNQDSQIQSLESYRLDDPGAVNNFISVLESPALTKSRHRPGFQKNVAGSRGHDSAEENEEKRSGRNVARTTCGVAAILLSS
jgi:hypothetical protein